MSTSMERLSLGRLPRGTAFRAAAQLPYCCHCIGSGVLGWSGGVKGAPEVAEVQRLECVAHGAEETADAREKSVRL